MLGEAITGVLFVLLMFGWAWLRQRRVFLFPSTWILLLSAMFYMLPALFFVDDIESLSPYTWTAIGYCTAFVGAGLLLNLILPSPAWAEIDWTPRSRTSRIDSRRTGAYLLAVLAVLGVVTVWYLSHVPIASTGLYGLLADPVHSAQLREESLKLLDNPALQYAYLIGFSCLSPLAFALWLERAATMGLLQKIAVGSLVLAFLAFYLLLTGARVGIVNLAAVGLFYAMVTNRMRIGLRVLVFAIAAIWLVPVAISIMREQGRNEAGLFEYVLAIGDRIFLLPLLISGWFVEFAETHGYGGLEAALGLGSQPDWTSLIALEFLGRRDEISIASVAAPSSFYFTNYLYFGWRGLLPSLVALKLADLPVTWLGRLPETLARPMLATLLYFSLIYVRSAFGATVISHGYVVLVLIVLVAMTGTRVGNTPSVRLSAT